MSFNTLAHHPLFHTSGLAARIADHPIGFIDVGARGGAHELVEPIAAVTGVLGFEPDEEECRALLADPAVTSPWKRFVLEPTALAATTGEATLHLLAAPTNHSLLPPNPAFLKRYSMTRFEEVGQCALTTEPLDAVLAAQHADEPYWGEIIKVDVQGGELDVLRGAETMLRDATLALVSEVEFFPVYAGQPLFSDVELFLRQRGFAFWGFDSVHHRSDKRLDKRVAGGKERLMWADAVFFRDPLAGSPAPYDPTPRQAAILVISALLLDHYEYALELADAYWPVGAEREALIALIQEGAAMAPAAAALELSNAAARAAANPADANLELGWFVGRHRFWGDYEAQLGSPHPIRRGGFRS